MTRILALDASTEACSVALLNGDEVTERYELAPRKHAQLLLPMVKSLLADSHLGLNQLDAIACNVGPGAFTGIRIAVSVAQGLSFGANLPAIGVSSLSNLAALGYSETGNSEWLCAIDARMSEVYFAGYKIRNGLPQIIDHEKVIAPSKIDYTNYQTISFNQCQLIGSGWSEYAKELYINGLNESQLLLGCYPRAKFSLKLAQAQYNQKKLLAPQDLQPIYLRNNVAVKKSAKN
jgi:tRNA threonylcarbamoyladenosine biosynthesis protein TsaB